MQGFQMPRGYHWTKGERFDKLAEQNKSQMFAGILAITFVFFLMGVLFESFILPLSVVICIPFAFVGGMWMLYVTHTVMDLMVAIGAIILIGIVVNNAIVLVDLINRMRAAGVNRNEALLAACDKRLRPILMTALTTIVGLFPMAIGGAGLIGIPYAPMGRIMIGGLVSATFFTPLVVPLMYTYLDDLRTHWSRLLAGIFK
jgi:HAE1 family hydrophobic/amphiphilic exporter-1